MTKIDKKIVAFSVVTDNKQANTPEVISEHKLEKLENTVPEFQPEIMHENIKRPEILLGSTYRIKTPLSEHAFYITINDIVLNSGTGHEHKRPFELFINSKNMEQFQWIVAMTRILSAVFRKGGDVVFLVEEMRSIFDPKGGYFRPGGRYMPSLVAEIGDIIEIHLMSIGLLKKEADPHVEAYLKAKKEQVKSFESVSTKEKKEEIIVEVKKVEDVSKAEDSDGFPANATLCDKCMTRAVIKVQGCDTCLECANSHCG